jgi:hypothetical protein
MRRIFGAARKLLDDRDILAVFVGNQGWMVICRMEVNVNTITEFDEASAPIRGVKGSGWGRNNGKFGLREFLVEKMLSVHEPDAALNFG